MLLNYHIGRFVLGSMYVGDLVRLKPATRTLLKTASDTKLVFYSSAFFKYFHIVLTCIYMLHALFWVIPRRLNFICQRFGTSCLFHLHKRVGMKNNCAWECWGIFMGKDLVQGIFKPNLFPYKYPNILNPIYSSYLPACEDGTDRMIRNVGI